MFNRNTRKTTFIFMGIILVTVFFDLVIADHSFSDNSGVEAFDNGDLSADVQKASWFWKNL